MFKVMKTPERHQNVYDVILVSLLLILNIFLTFFSISIAQFKQVIVCWEWSRMQIPVKSQ